MKYKKVQVNLIYHVIPAALLFIALKLYIVWYSIDFFNREDMFDTSLESEDIFQPIMTHNLESIG